MATPRVAYACDADQCAHLRVNGDRVSFVSQEQLRKYGWTPLVEGISNQAREKQLPADIKSVPKNFVLVHDANGTILSPCELYILRWQGGGAPTAWQSDADRREAVAYFGRGEAIEAGRVTLPGRGSFRRICRVSVIRYTRAGERAGDYEHPYDFQYPKPVTLSICRQPLAFRLSLPDGCLIDDRGFVRP